MCCRNNRSNALSVHWFMVSEFFPVRRFENVMILGVPASIQFTRGFLKLMMQATKGGFLPGNILTMAIKASKFQSLRCHLWHGAFDQPSILHCSFWTYLMAILSASGDLTFTIAANQNHLPWSLEKSNYYLVSNSDRHCHWWLTVVSSGSFSQVCDHPTSQMW